MGRYAPETLDFFFKPRSIAVIGASRTPGRPGYTLVENLRAAYGGEIYPINTQVDSIAGLKAYPSVMDVPGNIDLAVILIPAEQAVSAVRQCAEKNVAAVIVEASDFAEIGPLGKLRQDEITRIARDAKMRLWGPNCLGVIDTRSQVVTTYMPLRDVKPGRVSLVTQSGALAGAVLLQIHEGRVFSFNKVCSIGNKADVDETDLLEYLGQDPDTRVIAMYLESINDGKRFIELARAVSLEKPIIILKSGHTALGTSASLSHTASLTGDDRVVDAAFSDAGIIRVHDIGEFLTVTKAFDRLYDRTAGRRVAVVCTTGAGGVLAADQIDSHDLSIASLSESTLARLHEQFPSWLQPNQPVDVSPTMMKIGPNRALQYAASAVLADDGVDALLVQTFGLPATAQFDPSAFSEVVLKSGKPCVAWLYGLKAYLDPWRQALEENGIPVMPDLRSAARALQCLALWNEYRSAQIAHRVQFPVQVDCKTSATPQSAIKITSVADAFALLRSHGIPVAQTEVSNDPETVVSIAARIGYPVVVKAADLSLQHKSDIGAVKLNIRSAQSARDAVAAVRRVLPDGASQSIVVQQMVKPGLEVIVGGVRDPQFGPVVICGLGGIWVEILKDTVLRLAPITEERALSMLQELRAFPILAGGRGQPALDIGSIARVIVAVGRIMLEHPNVRSLDINPFVAYPDGEGGCAIDVLIDLYPCAVS